MMLICILAAVVPDVPDCIESPERCERLGIT